jgi:CHAT domain-containing protein/tetratricopeptide (TPR) repeat protein
MRTLHLAIVLVSEVISVSAAFLLPSVTWAQSSDSELKDLNIRIGELYGARKYAEVLPLIDRYVALARARHGEEHIQFATAIAWLGLLYSAQARYADAEPHLMRVLAIREKLQGPLHTEVAQSLSNLGVLYRLQGRYADAEPLLKRALSIREKLRGLEHPGITSSLNELAVLYLHQGRTAEAEPLLKRSLVITEKALGRDHADVVLRLYNLAGLYQDQGRLAEAEPLYARALTISEKALPAEHPSIGNTAIGLARLYRAQGRYTDAEPLARRAISVFEKAWGPEHPLVAQSLNNLAALYADQGRDVEAEPLYKRSLVIDEKVLGPHHHSVGTGLNNIAKLYQRQGRHAEAEVLFKRSLEIYEKALGLEHHLVGTSLSNLAGLFVDQGRSNDAEPLYKRSLEIAEKSLGPNHPSVGSTLLSLAGLYKVEGRYSDAEPIYKRVLSIFEKALGPDHPDLGTSLVGLAGLYQIQGQYAEAEPLYQRSLAIHESALGPDHSDVGAILNNLASLYRERGWYAKAAPLYGRSLRIAEKALGPDHLSVSVVLWQLAALSAEQGDGNLALAYQRRATASRTKRARVGELGNGRKGELAQSAKYFRFHVVAADLAGGDRAALLPETFEMAQWALQTEAADALAQMGARFGIGGGALALAVREQQDLLRRLKELDGRLIAAAGKADAAAGNSVRKDIIEIEARLNSLGQVLARDYPDYAALAHPMPIDVTAVRSALNANEAIIVLLDTPSYPRLPEATYAWLITKSNARWLKLPLTPSQMADSVAVLRCGLDRSAWDSKDGSRCDRLVKGDYRLVDADAGKPLPFDLVRAHELYRALFGQVEDLIKDKHLLVVPSGALTALPFQVLVTEKPGSAISNDINAYRDVAWLARRHAITVLPSVSSIKTLRGSAKTSKATQPFIGFGNPLLLGPDGNDRSAWERQSCKGSSAPVQIAHRSIRAAIPKFFRGGLADVEKVRAQYPLPETADELCAVAQSMGAGQGAVYLGEKATETTIKAVSANGTFAEARVVHFATHGLLAGETEMLAASKAEPALLLTPPAQATEEDDGLLTASEIGQLKLDADWVVLSACNTAASSSDKPAAEALSGLARAFFYAGARALLVSHWAVNSDATVKLITKVFEEINANSKIGRAEALRRSMLALIASDDRNAHPANWAPFVVVGEGTR